MKEVEKWNANHGKKNENRTDRCRIGEERDENGYMDREDKIKKIEYWVME